MYSRYGENSNRPVRLPEHYGGSAFSQGPTEAITVTKREQAKPYLGGVGEKASPIAERMLHADPPEELHEDAAALDALEAVDEKNSAHCTSVVCDGTTGCHGELHGCGL